jgi:hypothetical protein
MIHLGSAPIQRETTRVTHALDDPRRGAADEVDETTANGPLLDDDAVRRPTAEGLGRVYLFGSGGLHHERTGGRGAGRTATTTGAQTHDRELIWSLQAGRILWS